MKPIRLISILSCWLVFTSAIHAGAPTTAVKETADRILAILQNPQLQGDARKTERRRLIRQEIDARFNWPAIGRGCLGRHWPKRTPKERQEFIQLFGEFLESAYMEKFEVYYNDLDRIDYQSEKIIDNYASVKIMVVTRQKIEHPVEYRLEKSPPDNAWRVYDVVIEGVSMIKNYRDQFDEIIARSAYEGLIKELKEKVNLKPSLGRL